jgi:hypothetical protein
VVGGIKDHIPPNTDVLIVGHLGAKFPAFFVGDNLHDDVRYLAIVNPGKVAAVTFLPQIFRRGDLGGD